MFSGSFNMFLNGTKWDKERSVMNWFILLKMIPPDSRRSWGIEGDFLDFMPLNIMTLIRIFFYLLAPDFVYDQGNHHFGQ